MAECEARAFRSAHEIVARAVREALDQKKQLNEIDLAACGRIAGDRYGASRLDGARSASTAGAVDG